MCGMLGHLYKEHGTGIHPPSALVFRIYELAGPCAQAKVLERAEVGEVAVGEAGQGGVQAIDARPT